MKTSSRSSQGFTLIELLVVISIVAVLAGMLLPAVAVVRDAAITSTCVSNQRQFMLATIAYAGDYEDRTPPADMAVDPVTGTPGGGGGDARMPHLLLMFHDYLPTSHLISTTTSGWCTWDYGKLRWPNPLACPAMKPTITPTQQRYYAVRWQSAAPAPDAYTYNKQGSWPLAKMSNTVPYLADADNPSNPGTNGYWITVAVNWGSIPYLAHRGKAVMGYKDGRVLTRSNDQLLGEDLLLHTNLTP